VPSVVKIAKGVPEKWERGNPKWTLTSWGLKQGMEERQVSPPTPFGVRRDEGVEKGTQKILNGRQKKKGFGREG